MRVKNTVIKCWISIDMGHFKPEVDSSLNLHFLKLLLVSKGKPEHQWVQTKGRKTTLSHSLNKMYVSNSEITIY